MFILKNKSLYIFNTDFFIMYHVDYCWFEIDEQWTQSLLTLNDNIYTSLNKC